jgi:DNA invertase Pin-like site-specific DNA recombinase
MASGQSLRFCEVCLEVRSPKLRAIAYYRHSIQSQREDSIASQRDQVRKWASEHDFEIIHEFYDAGSSMGVSDERSAFTEMMQAGSASELILST